MHPPAARTALQRHVDEGHIAGAVTLVARRGEPELHEAVGHRHLEAGEPMRTDTIFRIASMTKPITSAALMILCDQGRVRLDDPVSRFLPDFAEMQVAVSSSDPDVDFEVVPAERPIEVRHLLTHTAGLPNPYRGITRRAYLAISERRGADETVAAFVDRLATLPLNFQPGEAWEYSRATCVAGRIVEVVSGLSLDAFLRERIFDPLGMPDTHFYLPAEKVERFAAYYAPTEDGGIRLEEAPTPDSRWVREPRVYFMGSGGLVSTARDYWRFQQMILNGGALDGNTLLSPASVAGLTRSQTGDLPLWLTGPGYGYGYGYGVVTDPAKTGEWVSEGTFGWGGIYGTYSWVDPRQDLVGVLMTQLRPYQHLRLRQELVAAVYGA